MFRNYTMVGCTISISVLRVRNFSPDDTILVTFYH